MNPELEQLFKDSLKTQTPGKIFVLRTARDDKGVLHGSFNYVSRKDLENRQYQVKKLQENKHELFFTDITYTRGCKIV